VQESRNQLAIAAFADALTVIPKQLTVNAAKDAVELVSQLRAAHNTAQTDAAQAQLRWTGLDLEHGVLRDNVQAGIVEPGMSKIKCIKFATEAAITILRIDEAIKIAVCPCPKRGGAFHACALLLLLCSLARMLTPHPVCTAPCSQRARPRTRTTTQTHTRRASSTARDHTFMISE
jgi:hypothetical protein